MVAWERSDAGTNTGSDTDRDAEANTNSYTDRDANTDFI